MPWERDLQSLERAIRDLNAQYDAFLFGSSSKPPLEVRRRVHMMIRRLSGEEADTAAERFRFTTLQGRFNTLCERWDRLQAEKEAGRRPGIYGHFTRLPTDGSQDFDMRPNVRPPVSVEEPETAAGMDPVRDLFERYVAAKRAHGEDVAGLDLENFVAKLARERERLKAQFGGAEIEFDVVERDGQVRLVARPKK
jgi:hypothetical protein